MEGETWQDNYSVVSNVEVNGRTAFSVATEPGDARHAFKSSGRRRSAGWFTVPSSQRPLVSDQRSLGEGYWRDRAAMCPTFNRDHQGSNPCASIASWDVRLVAGFEIFTLKTPVRFWYVLSVPKHVIAAFTEILGCILGPSSGHNDEQTNDRCPGCAHS